MSEHETALVGEATGRRYRLGDAVTVKVERVDRLRGKVDLAPASRRRRPLTGRHARPPDADGRAPAAPRRPGRDSRAAAAADRRLRGGRRPPPAAPPAAMR